MIAVTTCRFSWCTIDHTDTRNDVDGHGATFHLADGTFGAFTPPGGSKTWTCGEVTSRLIAYDSARAGAATEPLRLEVTMDAQSSLDAGALRALAAWLVEQADALVALPG